MLFIFKHNTEIIATVAFFNAKKNGTYQEMLEANTESQTKNLQETPLAKTIFFLIENLEKEWGVKVGKDDPTKFDYLVKLFSQNTVVSGIGRLLVNHSSRSTWNGWDFNPAVDAGFQWCTRRRIAASEPFKKPYPALHTPMDPRTHVMAIAASCGDIASIQRLLTQYPEAMFHHVISVFFGDPLTNAAREGDINTANLLLSHGYSFQPYVYPGTLIVASRKHMVTFTNLILEWMDQSVDPLLRYEPLVGDVQQAINYWLDIEEHSIVSKLLMLVPTDQLFDLYDTLHEEYPWYDHSPELIDSAFLESPVHGNIFVLRGLTEEWYTR